MTMYMYDMYSVGSLVNYLIVIHQGMLHFLSIHSQSQLPMSTLSIIHIQWYLSIHDSDIHTHLHSNSLCQWITVYITNATHTTINSIPTNQHTH